MKLQKFLLAFCLGIFGSSVAIGGSQQRALKCGIGHMDFITNSFLWDDVAIVGNFEKIPESQLNGAWAGGSGYNLTTVITEQELLKSTEPITTTFSCYARKGERTYSCRSPLEILANVPGFDMLKGQIDLDPEGWGSPTANEQFTMSLQLRYKKGPTFYIQSREMVCEVPR